MPTAMSVSDLRSKRCAACKPGTPPVDEAVVRATLAQMPGWALDGGAVTRAFKFDDYHQTMAFVNAVAWVAHREDHHPDLEVGYGRCVVRYATHSIGGISENDLICAAKVGALVDGSET